jgi:hypothetical protein
VIVVDNVVRDGALADAAAEDPGVQGMRRFHELLASEPRAQATTIQTVGGKGYDGFTLVLLDEQIGSRHCQRPGCRAVTSDRSGWFSGWRRADS